MLLGEEGQGHEGNELGGQEDVKGQEDDGGEGQEQETDGEVDAYAGALITSITRVQGFGVGLAGGCEVARSSPP